MTITCGEARLSATAEKPETFFLRRESSSATCEFAFRRVGSCDWFGEGQCLDWHCPYSPFRSYLFLLAARGCLRRRPAAPTPVPPAPSGPAGAPSPPRSMGGPSHFLQRAAHRDAFVSCTLEEEAVVRLRIRTLFNPQTQKKKKKKRDISLYSYYCSIIYIFTSFSPFHTVQECCGNHSSVCHRAGIRPASETADFNLYLNPLGPRVQTQTKLLGLCRERVRLKSLFSYSAPCGDVIYEEKEFLKGGDVKVQRFTLLEVDLC